MPERRCQRTGRKPNGRPAAGERRLGELQRQAAEFTPNKDKAAIGENILGLRLLCLYGLKGAAAYMEHAHVLGQYDNAIYAQYHKIMAWLGTGLPR